MTNDPSTAITSTTAPAPEVSDSTSREGNALPLPVTEGGSAPPVPDAPPPSLVRKIGGTIYEMTLHFSTTRQETKRQNQPPYPARTGRNIIFSEFPHSLLDILTEMRPFRNVDANDQGICGNTFNFLRHCFTLRSFFQLC